MTDPMSLLTRVTDRFRIEAQREPSSESDIEKLVEFSPIAVPEDYLEIVREATEVEIDVDGGAFLRIWGAAESVAMNEDYEVQRYLPQGLAVGDDGGGNAVIYLNSGSSSGVFLCDFGALDEEEMRFLASSLEDLLTRGIGIEVLKAEYE